MHRVVAEEGQDGYNCYYYYYYYYHQYWWMI